MDKIDYKVDYKSLNDVDDSNSDYYISHSTFISIVTMLVVTVILAVIIGYVIIDMANSMSGSTNEKVMVIGIKDKYIDVSDNTNYYYILDTNNEIYLLEDYTDTKGNVVKMYNFIQVDHTYQVTFRVLYGNDRRIDVNKIIRMV